MKLIENYLNVLHFYFYKAHFKSHLLANKINPFRLLVEIPFIKNRLEKKGIKDFQKEIDKVFGNKNFGVSVTVAGGLLLTTLFIFFLSLLNIFNIFVFATIPYFIVSFALPFIMCYFFVFKNDKYLKYFEKYENWRPSEKQNYSWLTFGSIIALFLLFYLGLKTLK